MPGKRDARARVMAAAIELVSQGGPAAASPDAVAARAGASKMSMYRHFDGKDEMLVAALVEQEERFRLDLLVREPAASPALKVRAIFGRLAERADRNPDSVGGCPYVMTELAIDDAEHPTKAVVARHKEAMRRDLADVVATSVGADAERIASLILMLLDGALAHARIDHSGEPLRRAGEMAASWV
jgi:AcrR family transcriptional regulator